MQLSGALTDVLVALPAAGGFRSLDFRHSFHPACSDSKNLLSASGVFLKNYSQSCFPRLNAGLCKCRARGLIVKASGDSNDNLEPVAPLRCESPVGQLLLQILQTHPHLLPATIDQHLEHLQTERDAQQKEESSLHLGERDPLYKRIAEVKEKERRKALEEIIYCFIVHKFVENNILMIPKVSETSDPTGRVDFWPNQEQKLEAVHSPEAFEMIQSHLSLLLGERQVGPLNTFVEISKIKLGKLYAASIMYGYFLKRVDERYQLERTMKTLPKDFREAKSNLQEPSPANKMWDPDSLIEIPVNDLDDEGGFLGTNEDKSNRLRSYVMHLDADTLQRYATIRSKEAMSLIEKQTQALFGKPDIRISDDGTLDTSNDEVITLTFSGLTMLVLEAAAFGSFLWVAESHAEPKYDFMNN